MPRALREPVPSIAGAGFAAAFGFGVAPRLKTPVPGSSAAVEGLVLTASGLAKVKSGTAGAPADEEEPDAAGTLKPKMRLEPDLGVVAGVESRDIGLDVGSDSGRWKDPVSHKG